MVNDIRLLQQVLARHFVVGLARLGEVDRRGRVKARRAAIVFSETRGRRRLVIPLLIFQRWPRSAARLLREHIGPKYEIAVERNYRQGLNPFLVIRERESPENEAFIFFPKSRPQQVWLP